MKSEIFLSLILFFSGCVYYNANDSSLGETTIADKTFVIKPFQTYYSGGNSSTDSVIGTFRYQVSSSEPVNVYVVSTKGDFEKLANGKEFSHYPSCRGVQALRYDQKCTISNEGGIAIQNNNFKETIITLKVSVIP